MTSGKLLSFSELHIFMCKVELIAAFFIKHSLYAELFASINLYDPNNYPISI